MTSFEDLFGDMGEAYTAIVRAHLQIKAQAGNPEAQRLLAGDGPQPGDVVWAKDTTWTWDSASEADWMWWSAKLRISDELTDGYRPIVWQGQPVRPDEPGDGEPVMPAAAVELFNAVDWMLATATLCRSGVNPRTEARFYQPVGVDTVAELIEVYRAGSLLPADGPAVELRVGEDEGMG